MLLDVYYTGHQLIQFYTLNFCKYSAVCICDFVVTLGFIILFVRQRIHILRRTKIRNMDGDILAYFKVTLSHLAERPPKKCESE
jgi:hypothetical protein